MIEEKAPSLQEGVFRSLSARWQEGQKCLKYLRDQWFDRSHAATKRVARLAEPCKNMQVAAAPCDANLAQHVATPFSTVDALCFDESGWQYRFDSGDLAPIPPDSNIGLYILLGVMLIGLAALFGASVYVLLG